MNLGQTAQDLVDPFQLEPTRSLGRKEVVHQPEFLGGHNFATDPRFVAPVSYTCAPTSLGDDHLRAVSPCRDKGTGLGAPSVDIDGEARPTGGGHDVGSDEVVWK